MDIRQTNCPERHKGHLGGFRGSHIQRSGKAVKRLDRLAPTLVHVCGFIWEWAYFIYKSPLNTPWGMSGGGLGGHKFKSWEAVKRLDRLAPNLYTSVDSSGNGHRLKTIRPTIPRGGILGGFMGSTIQKTGKCGQTAGPIGNQFAHIMHRNLVMYTGWTNWPHETPRGAFWRGFKWWQFLGGLGGLIYHQMSGECHDIQRKQI